MCLLIIYIELIYYLRKAYGFKKKDHPLIMSSEEFVSMDINHYLKMLKRIEIKDNDCPLSLSFVRRRGFMGRGRKKREMK